VQETLTGNPAARSGHRPLCLGHLPTTVRTFKYEAGTNVLVPKSTDPADRCGVYTALDEVPDTDRLRTYADTYANRDVWTEFCEAHLFAQYDSERFQHNARRAGEHWIAHCRARERHHALATPTDVESWCAALLAERAVSTAYNQYWVRIERFYTWLQRSCDHPHVYQPVRMAAVEGDAARTIWREKIERGRDGGAA
jgi:hypothetical protein